MGFAKPIATTRSSTGMSTGIVAVWWVVASEIVIFGGILGSYLMHRLGHPEWAAQSVHTHVWFGGLNTMVLLTSSYCAVLAHNAAEMGNGKKAAKLLWMTVLLGGVFLVVKSIEWTGEIQNGYTITSGMFWSFYYIAAGVHGCHVIAGMILMIWVAGQAKRGVELQRVELIGIYWHFVDLVWIFLFPLLYIAK